LNSVSIKFSAAYTAMIHKRFKNDQLNYFFLFTEQRLVYFFMKIILESSLF